MYLSIKPLIDQLAKIIATRPDTVTIDYYIEHSSFKLTEAELLHQMSRWGDIKNDA